MYIVIKLWIYIYMFTDFSFNVFQLNKIKKNNLHKKFIYTQKYAPPINNIWLRHCMFELCTILYAETTDIYFNKIILYYYINREKLRYRLYMK